MYVPIYRSTLYLPRPCRCLSNFYRKKGKKSDCRLIKNHVLGDAKKLPTYQRWCELNYEMCDAPF